MVGTGRTTKTPDLEPEAAGGRECRLCGSRGPLQNSHIFPEFTYKPIYDERHKGVLFNPLDPERAWKFQKGLRERLLCRGCEQFLNDEYEKPFKELWVDGRPLAQLETRAEAILHVPDYERFKLFHLSVLLRADLASRSEFGEVDLGARHRGRLREMVRGMDAGSQHEYPIVCMAISQPDDGSVWRDLVSSPNPGRVHGMRFYQFTFGGCGWMYFVGSHRNGRIDEIALRADGTLPVIKRPWAAIKRFAPHARFK